MGWLLLVLLWQWRKKTYLKIGCKATYRIRTDNLADNKEKKCDSYVNAIKKCNSSYYKALAYSGGSGALFGIIIGLVAANVAFPPSVIVTIVIAAVGGSGGVTECVLSLISCHDYYKDAADIYITIRTYGTKI